MKILVSNVLAGLIFAGGFAAFAEGIPQSEFVTVNFTQIGFTHSLKRHFPGGPFIFSELDQRTMDYRAAKACDDLGLDRVISRYPVSGASEGVPSSFYKNRH